MIADEISSHFLDGKNQSSSPVAKPIMAGMIKKDLFTPKKYVISAISSRLPPPMISSETQHVVNDTTGSKTIADLL